MLYLKYRADETTGDASPRVVLSEQAALEFERALLQADDAARRQVVLQVLANDRDLAGWALRTAEHRLGRTVNRVEEAVDWLAGNLVAALVDLLASDTSPASECSIEWRLPALAARLAAYDSRLSEFDQRLEREKLESLKELAYGASHEINNPLANIAARAQTLLDDEEDSERARKLSAIHRQAMRAHEMIADLMLFARPPQLVRKRIDLRDVATKVVDELAELAAESGVSLSCDRCDDRVEVDADETQIDVALQALVKNAVEAVAHAGHVVVAVKRAVAKGADVAEVCVSDDGPGIPDHVRRHMFDPFFSGREAGRGLGFGLPKCWRIVTDHGGEVVVLSRGGSGAEICIRLPLAQ
jgi:signal transduction histidine kinase